MKNAMQRPAWNRLNDLGWKAKWEIQGARRERWSSVRVLAGAAVRTVSNLIVRHAKTAI